ncbi:hypothetical protein C8F04DRAFT_1260306 [Mycena alexandri]|uniref:Uncharacterized protein n=1 Tax=Mycena alexandri TaxID=1745969 RepID=A0AAD6SWK3_9AGAR|nr:hypothetical protein C8F04DRAFT_1260306 [Mycena alexandri]
MRVVLVSSSVETVDSGPVAQLRPVAPPAMPAQLRPVALPAMPTKQQHAPCGRLRQKATSISEAFKIAFGFKVREKTHLHPVAAIDMKHYVPLPFIGTPNGAEILEAHTKGSDKLRIPNGDNLFHILPYQPPTHGHGHGRFRHHTKNEHSFLMRVHFALMSLGPWEGRAVAFVLGCGIGVLLRMFWVMAVISYRLIKGARPASESDEHEYAVIGLDMDAEEIFVAPPMYTYPVEKVEVVEPIAVIVPATESK